MKKAEKLDVLHDISARVVDEFVLQNQTSVKAFVDSVLTEEEKDQIVNNQNLTPDGRFPCRYPGCDKSFKYNGKSRKKHEMSHDPPVQIEELPIECTGSYPKDAADLNNLLFESPKEEKATAPKEESKTDDIYNYNSALFVDCFLFFNFLDAIKEGDGLRIMRQYKYMMLNYKADGSHSTKYSLECLYQFFLIYGLLSERDSKRFIWNRSVNNLGLKGANIPLDEDTEHSNNFLKQGIRNLGPNVTDQAITRLCRAEGTSRLILANLDESINRESRSGKHGKSSDEMDMDELVRKGMELDILRQQEDQEGRTYQHFFQFSERFSLKLKCFTFVQLDKQTQEI